MENHEQRDPRVYELGFHLLPTLAEDARQQALEKIEKSITSRGEKISEGKLEHVELAYPIDLVIDNKRTTFRNAYFGWIKFEVVPEELESLKEDLDTHRGLLRYLLIATVREDTMVVAPRKKAEDNSEATMEAVVVPEDDAKNPSEEDGTEDASVDEAELDAKLDDIVSEETAAGDAVEDTSAA